MQENYVVVNILCRPTYGVILRIEIFSEENTQNRKIHEIYSVGEKNLERKNILERKDTEKIIKLS